jgi:prepilin-type N-terminal cleavage/methylation domain-containing protein
MAPETTTRRAEAQDGYSLVEVMIASALLATVLLSIAGVFMTGTQSVQSGREMTEAVTIANSIVEQVLGWPYEKVWGMTGGTAESTTATWRNDRTLPAYTGDPTDVADWTATAQAWKETVETSLNQGTILYRVDGIERLPDGADDGLTTYRDAVFLRVTVTVRWTEARGRQREVVFEEIKL